MHGPTEFDEVRRYALAEKVRRAAFVACISDYCRSQPLKLAEFPEEVPSDCREAMATELPVVTMRIAGIRDSSRPGVRRIVGTWNGVAHRSHAATPQLG